jgi:hypothetical protein
MISKRVGISEEALKIDRATRKFSATSIDVLKCRRPEMRNALKYCQISLLKVWTLIRWAFTKPAIGSLITFGTQLRHGDNIAQNRACNNTTNESLHVKKKGYSSLHRKNNKL